MDTLLLIGAASASAALVLVAVVAAHRRKRRRAGRAGRLDAAYERARYARRTGTMGSDRGYIR